MKKGQTKATTVKTTTTKTTKKQVFSPEDTQVFTNVFSLFDTQGNGKLDIGELLNAMEAFKFDKTNPGIFDLLSELDTPEAKKNGGLTMTEFTTDINERLGDTKSKEGIKRTFELFSDGDAITVKSLTKSAEELNSDVSPDEIRSLVEKAANNNEDIPYEEFEEIISTSIV
jgi:Ca2+-binding EF-hand superfamily protein